MRKIGMAVPDNKNIAYHLKTIKEAGFECIMVNYPNDNEPVEEILENAFKYSLSISSLHAPVADINTFWEEGEKGDMYLEFIKKRVDFCKKNNIKIMVAHTTFGNSFPKLSEIGFKRFSLLNDYAEENNVHICYENVNEINVLKSVMDKTGNFHGFCWDIGHNMAYTPETDFNFLFENRLMYVHIHDNYGEKDLHEMPFSCSINWHKFADTLKCLNYVGDLNFEPSYRLFLQSDSVKFINTAFERMNKLRNLL